MQMWQHTQTYRTAWKCWIKEEHVGPLWYQVTASMSITCLQEHHLKHLKKYYSLGCWMHRRHEKRWKNLHGNMPQVRNHRNSLEPYSELLGAHQAAQCTREVQPQHPG
jgi:hypothetical protein